MKIDIFRQSYGGCGISHHKYIGHRQQRERRESDCHTENG